MKVLPADFRQAIAGKGQYLLVNLNLHDISIEELVRSELAQFSDLIGRRQNLGRTSPSGQVASRTSHRNGLARTGCERCKVRCVGK